MKKILMHTDFKPISDTFDTYNKCSCTGQKSCGCNGSIDPIISIKTASPTYQGTVKATDGSPLIGAHVVNLNTKKGEVTDDNGFFIIEANPDDVLKISFVGFNDVTIPAVQLPTVLNMQDDKNVLDEVVVTATKTAKKNPALILGAGLLGLFFYSKSKQNKPVKRS